MEQQTDKQVLQRMINLLRDAYMTNLDLNLAWENVDRLKKENKAGNTELQSMIQSRDYWESRCSKLELQLTRQTDEVYHKLTDTKKILGGLNADLERKCRLLAISLAAATVGTLITIGVFILNN